MMNKIKKQFALICAVVLAVCAFTGTVSARQYGYNVISDSEKYDSSNFLMYDANNDGYFDIVDLVRTKKAAADDGVSINKAALGLSSDDKIDATVISTLRIQLLKK